jgi:hypothetical protein
MDALGGAHDAAVQMIDTRFCQKTQNVLCSELQIHVISEI